MAYQLKTMLSHKSNYGSKRSTASIKWIVVHYTGNDGDSDEANGKYFQGANRCASAHYFIDDDSITQSVPDDYIAWSVGGNRYPNYKQTGGAKHYGQANNTNTLNIELCDAKKDGKVMATEKTLDNAVTFIKQKMKDYNVDIAHVIRHFDVTGKSCPAYFCDSLENNKKWEEFKNRLKCVDKSKDRKEIVNNKKVADTKEEYKVRIVADVLNVRNGAGTSYKVNNKVEKGEIFTIVSEKNGWGKLKSGAGWVFLAYTKRI